MPVGLLAKKTAAQKEELKRQRMEEIMRALPDSVFDNVKIEDLLDDEVYLKLAKDGWTSREIATIMETAVKDKQKARTRASYGSYAKMWRPAFGRSMSDDPMYQAENRSLSAKATSNIEETVGTTDYNRSWEKIPYDPTARKRGERNKGYFRALDLNPTSGRVTWIKVNQNEDTGSELYVIADGAGIFSTHDSGDTWECITDNIPSRAARGVSSGYSLPVDPDNWDHLFAFMHNQTIFETKNGGKSWTQVEGGTTMGKTFKRGYAFRSKSQTGEDDITLIGAAMNNSNRMKNELWLSTDKGVTWRQLTLNNKPELMETIVSSGNTLTGFWFQQMAFDGDNRDIVYFPGCRSILYFDDGGKSGELKALNFNVYGADKNDLRVANTTKFPFPGNGAGHMEIDPNNPDRMWYTVGNSANNYTALYFSDDHGKNWITLHEPHRWDEAANNWKTEDASDLTKTYIGSGSLFGNETANVWLGGFGVEYHSEDRSIVPQNLFGCSMSSAYSNDGGRNWKEYAWGMRQRSLIKSEYNPRKGEGYYYVSASRHNADNHCIASHKSGRVFRASDGGLFMHDPKISGQTNDADGNAIALPDWVNIAGHMGQMLFYDVRVNEFGDQAIIGNTQDIDVQTYRYGRWGHWRGYEGTEASFNPYTSTGYFSGGGGAGPEGMNADSWHTARNYADVVTGSWFMLRTWSGNSTPSTLFRVDNVGRSLTNLYDAIGKTVTHMSLARDKGRLTVFVRTSGDNALWMSTDSCKTFVPLMAYNGKSASFSNTYIAGDPDNSNILYLGQNGGKCLKYTVDKGTWEAMGTGLPTSANCSRLLFHEGSGDLYYVDYNSGIYLLKHGETQWKFWTKGYNPADFSDCDINYTTQEMVIADYGRGVWVADLETPSDRYFGKAETFGSHRALRIKEYSHRDGRRTFGIDTKWTIPMYYNYQWYIDNVPVKNNNYQYLNLSEEESAGKELKLVLTLRESPDVSTESEAYKVQPSVSKPIERRQGNALYSNGQGRVDIGYMDWFYDDFSVDLWVKPESDGVILANSQKDIERGAKGWLLYVEGGLLKFKYYPSNLLQLPTYEATLNQNPVINGGALPMKKWSHVAVTQERRGNIKLYINGQEVASAERIRKDEEHSLNNSVIMSLFGDAFENSTLRGAVDELKFWKKALTVDEVRREMFSTDVAGSGQLVAHYDFNGEELSADTETFTGYVPKSRTMAVTSAQRMTVPVSANYVASATLDGKKTLTSSVGNLPLMTIDAGNQSGATAVVYGYDAERWNNPDDNLSEDYYTPTTYGYMLRTFGAIDSEKTADVVFHNGKGKFESNRNYRLYMADNSDDRMYWKQYNGDVLHDGNNLRLTNVRLNDITDRKLLLVTMNPAIEMTIENLSSDGRVILYDDEEELADFPFTARLLEGKHVAGNSYQIMSDSAVVVVPEVPLSFDNQGVARGTIKIDTDLIGDFNNVISTYVRGRNDNDMIPIPVDILNRITPKTLDNSLQIAKGCIRMGSAADFSWMKGINNFTMMGWVRVDSLATITSGRNGDGYAPLMFFRSPSNDATATGIHLYKGRLGYHWNDQYWNYSDQTAPFVIAPEDLGKWAHVAMVVKPEGVWLYFNGMEHKMNGTTGTIPGCKAESPLLLGTNTQGNYTYFSGAFDQVALWNRSLSREEIHKYMQSRVLLNDPGLMTYITMDEADDTGHYKESVSGTLSNNHYGKVNNGGATPVPFSPYRTDVMSSTGSPIKLAASVDGTVAAFEGTPYNYINSGSTEQQYLPLNHEYYTIAFNTKPSLTGDVSMTYSNDGLIDDETIAVGIRELGSLTPFTRYVRATTVSGGKAMFNIPSDMLAESAELMFFSTPESSHRPTIVRMNFADSALKSGDIYLLGDGVSEIPVNVNVVSGEDEVLISTVEDYVTLSRNVVDMNDPMQQIVIRVDKSKIRDIDRFGLHDVTVNLSGTTADPLTLKVGLKPRVTLKLKNGTDGEHFVAKTPVATLDIEAELEEGYLDKDVALKMTPDNLSSAFNIANGSLLNNSEVNIEGLKLGSSTETEQRKQGWNLVGNPYLTEINLTKHQNYSFPEGTMTHFVYHTLDGSDNILAYDMTDFDGDQHILPFQSYYVQTMTDDVALTVTENAKEKSLNRKTFDYYTANEVRSVTFRLTDENGKDVDRTTLKWEDGSRGDYIVNEDAAKMRAVNAVSNELYTLTTDGYESSINVQPAQSNVHIPLCVDVRNPGNLKLVVSNVSGFDGKANNVYLFDSQEFTLHPLTEGFEYEVPAYDQGAIDKRYKVIATFNNDTVTDADLTEADRADYRVYTDVRTMTVTGLQGDAQINVYNMSGMLIVRADTYESSYTTDVPSGVYIVRIRENGKEYVTKVIVK